MTIINARPMIFFTRQRNFAHDLFTGMKADHNMIGKDTAKDYGIFIACKS